MASSRSNRFLLKQSLKSQKKGPTRGACVSTLEIHNVTRGAGTVTALLHPDSGTRSSHHHVQISNDCFCITPSATDIFSHDGESSETIVNH